MVPTHAGEQVGLLKTMHVCVLVYE